MIGRLTLGLLSVLISEVAADKTSNPTTWATSSSDKVRRLHKSTLNHDSYTRFLQENPMDGVMNGGCQFFLDFIEDPYCTCAELEGGNVLQNCTDTTCQICDEDLKRCGIISELAEFGMMNDGYFLVGHSFKFDYTTGETLAVELSRCDESSICGDCEAFVNEETCTSCTVCEDGISLSIDCQNLAANLSFSECLAEPSDEEYGLFQGLLFGTCIYDKPANDACANSTVLRLDEASLGRTNGATEDRISSDCSLSSGKDVWYSVIGTGDTMIATTCNFGSFITTTIDVFSGSEMCESLQCVNATSVGCFGFSNGGLVSWPSEEGVLYHLRLLTPDFDDQFTIMAFDVATAENSACNVSVATSSVNAVGSTVGLSNQLETDICGETGTTGLWYKVTAEKDTVMRASTCSNNTSLYTIITVMTGSDCEALVCVASASSIAEFTYGCEEGGIIVEWNATTGQTFFVYVRGADSNGIFGVSIVPLELPDNDACEAANVVFLGDDVIPGNTANATEDFIVGAQCSGDTGTTLRGVWYQIQGNGNYLKASVCSGNSDEIFVSLYVGSCGNLTCVSDGVRIPSCGVMTGRAVSWEALDGVDYFLFVHSPFAAGTFKLTVEEFEPESNSKCSSTVGPFFPSNQTIIASTVNAVSDGILGCSSGYASPGLWYSVLGQENLTYRVDTCSNETNFDTEISVFEGECGVGLQCFVGNDDACNGLSSAVQWKAEEGRLYNIKTHGYSSNSGDFGVTFSSFVRPDNDDCSGGVVIRPGNDTIVISTAGATSDVVVGSCDVYYSDEPGLWYRIIGQGTAISASTCSPLTEADTLISVYTGSCGDLSCITSGLLDFFNCQELGAITGSVTFLAQEGKEYFLFIQSMGGIAGEIGLKVTEFETFEMDFCEGARNVEIDGEEISGTTVGASGSTRDTSCGFSTYLPDVWYTVQGTGDVLWATACSTEFNFSISVLEGNCTDLRCIGTRSFETCTNVGFLSVLGETYFILIQATEASLTGVFTLSVNASSAEALGNDLCSGAIPIDPSSNSIILGSTWGAITDSSIEDTCFTVPHWGDQWYMVTGSKNNSIISASLCSPETDFDTQLSIYTSLDDDGSCSNLECVTTNDDGCGSPASRATWRTEEDKVYLIRVHGYGDGMGNFALTVLEQEISLQWCQDANLIELSESVPSVVVEGSNLGGEIDGFAVESFCGIETIGPSKWFKIPGRGNDITVSTCSEFTDFDTIIEVYEGSCDLLSCNNWNDDGEIAIGGLLTCSYLSWTAVEGVDYYVKVSGFGGAEGNFELIASL
ncbi:hypothetical protein IV203_031821 [Nitzschia inconspicua]|uniref:Uncharacterized protein n=1 Tax=Nitzschia inconspicua TaxID=303405 RepID=A0A9K3LW29_9STRA|nr:hypothetical protein IV203_031821 [Nitzschia inconspicua]